MSDPLKTTPDSVDYTAVIQAARRITNNHSAVVCVDTYPLVIHWDAGLESLLGWSAKDIRFKLLQTIIPPQHREAHSVGMERFLQTGLPHVVGKTVSLPALHRDGHVVNTRMTIHHIPVMGTDYFCASIDADVTRQT